MKKFIEVTPDDVTKSSKLLVNTDHIMSVAGNRIFLDNGRSYYPVKESYEEIVGLIHCSQSHFKRIINAVVAAIIETHRFFKRPRK